MSDPIIRLDDVYKRYRLYRRRYQSLKEVVLHRRLGEWEDHWALHGISLEVEPGTTLGLIGPNGAGKSTTLKLMSRILAPDKGRVMVRGKVSGLLELGAGFQPDYSGLENTELNASLLGLSRNDIRRKLPQIVDFSELGDAVKDPLRTYSTGMAMRLAFSIAIHVDPEVLLVDEVLAVGDESFQKKCLDHIQRFQAAGGTIVMVSHSAGQVESFCNQAAWIEDGIVQAMGTPTSVVNAYVNRVRDRDASKEAAAEQEAKPAEIGEIQLLDAGGAPVRTVHPGDALTLRIPYRVNERVEKPMFGVSLMRNDGAYVYGTNTMAEGRSLGPLVNDGSVTFRYTGLPLLPGTFRVSVSMYDEDQLALPIDKKDRVYSFEVAGESDEKGIVRLDHEWELGADLEPQSSESRLRVG